MRALKDNLGFIIVAQIIGNGSEVELLAGAAANTLGGELQRLIRPAVRLLVRDLALAHCFGVSHPDSPTIKRDRSGSSKAVKGG